MADRDAAVSKARRARKAAKQSLATAAALVEELPKKQRRRLAAAADDLRDARGSKKQAARHPGRTRRRIEDASARLDERIAKARLRHDRATHPGAAGEERDAHDASAQADAEVLAEAQSAVLPAPGLEAFTMYELRRRAKEKGIAGYSRRSKAQLIEVLSAE